MFGSTNPFGQSSTSPFGSQSVFGQNNSNSNPFAAKPFGSTTPFGAQTGNSMFGGTSTGVFGAAQSSSPFPSTAAFGASSSPAFGSSVPAFGSSSTPSFGSSSSSFGGSSAFGQKPVFGGFGSTPTQTSPFGSATQPSQPAFGSATQTSQPAFGSATQPSQPAFGSATQPSQPAFGSSIFGSSTPFGASTQPTYGSTGTPAFGGSAFGGTSTPAFGGTSTPAFGGTSTPAFGGTSTPAFGATSTPAFGASATSTPAFGSTSSPPFGSTGSAFGVSSAPVFGGGGAFGASSNPMFGSSSTSAFGTSSTPSFGASSSPAFGASSSPAFGFGSAQAFGQSTSTFGSSSPFGGTTSPFGGQSSAFASQTPTPTFGNPGISQSGFGVQRGGSRVAGYTPTTEADSGTSGQTAKLESISAMPIYKDKSHEELRWEDYQLGDKGGPLPSAQSTGFSSSTTQTNAFSPSPVFGQSSANPFSSTTPSNSNPFALKTSTFSSGFGTSAAPAFSSSAFGSSTSATAPSIFGSSTSVFGANTSSSPSFGQSASLFNPAPAQGTSSPFGTSIFGNTQPSPLFSSALPTVAQTGSTFGQNTSPFGQTTSFGQSSLFNSPSSGLVGSIFSTSAPLTSNNLTGFGQTAVQPSMSTPFQPAQVAQSSGTFAFSNYGQTQPAGASNFSGAPGMFGQNNFGLPSYTQSSMVVQAAPLTDPFGTLPALPQMSIARAGTTPSIQYGISSMPALDKPANVRMSSLLTSRHLSRRMKFPVRKFNSKNDGAKVPFFGDDEDTPTTPKADALFTPRENPRALFIRPIEQWPARASEKASSFKDRSTPVNKNETAVENGHVTEQVQPTTTEQVVSNGSNEEHSPQKAGMYKTLSGYRAGEAAIVYEHGADVEALMPKLRRSDYYTWPRIHELAAKERAEPGFCSHVKDFVVGRQGYGSIRFLGETDVRGLDLESVIQFNNREVIVYMDDAKKPPVGQGLNKPAEVTLLNIKCFDKKTGNQYTEGPRMEKYKEMLKRKAEDQGAEFVSYDPTKGEWKIKVNHFSVYEC